MLIPEAHAFTTTNYQRGRRGGAVVRAQRVVTILSRVIIAIPAAIVFLIIAIPVMTVNVIFGLLEWLVDEWRRLWRPRC